MVGDGTGPGEVVGVGVYHGGVVGVGGYQGDVGCTVTVGVWYVDGFGGVLGGQVGIHSPWQLPGLVVVGNGMVEGSAGSGSSTQKMPQGIGGSPGMMIIIWIWIWSGCVDVAVGGLGGELGGEVRELGGEVGEVGGAVVVGVADLGMPILDPAPVSMFRPGRESGRVGLGEMGIRCGTPPVR